MAKYDFVAVDVETASKSNDSCCARGIVAVREGAVVDTFYSLVNYPGPFSPGNTRVNGITKQDVASAPSAAEIREQISKFFSPHWPTVGHNIKSFDSKILEGSFGIDASNLWLVDTLHICRLRLSIKPLTLDNCAAYFNIDMGQHHNALDDANTAAQIILSFCRLYGCIELTEMLAREPFFFGRLATKYYDKLPETLPGSLDIPAPYTPTAKSNISQMTEANAAYPSIKPTASEIDAANPLFGKVIVFTGFAPSNPLRATELAQIAVNHGAEIKQNISKKVDIVVCARIDDPDGFRTSKHQKAIDLKQSGLDIQIISEKEF